MHLAERSRPFYGPAHKAPKTKISPPKTTSLVPRKVLFKEFENVNLLFMVSLMCCQSSFFNKTSVNWAGFEYFLKLSE